MDQLCRRIESELSEIKRIKDHALRRWKKALRDEDYLGSVAFDLHGFYQGVERIFETIAKSIDRRIRRNIKAKPLKRLFPIRETQLFT